MVIKGRTAGLEFFAGYVVEQSLSVDNLFIFIMLFDYFKVPAEFQSRVLNWGIIGAMSMRAVMIVVGVAAIQRFRWVMLFFAGILVVSSANLLMEGEDDHDDSSHLENNTVLKIANWMCDSVDYYDGEKFFTLVDGVKKATPLLLCLICIELSDFVFAVDSIPAVLGISQDTFIVYASNVFAICAMRSIYTLVRHAISDLPYLKPAVALVLGFVGGKMFAEFFHYEIGVGLSLGVVCGILAVGAIASVIANKKRDAAAAASVTGGGSEGLTFKSIADEAGEASASAAASTLEAAPQGEQAENQPTDAFSAPPAVGSVGNALSSGVEEGGQPGEAFGGAAVEAEQAAGWAGDAAREEIEGAVSAAESVVGDAAGNDEGGEAVAVVMDAAAGAAESVPSSVGDVAAPPEQNGGENAGEMLPVEVPEAVEDERSADEN